MAEVKDWGVIPQEMPVIRPGRQKPHRWKWTWSAISELIALVVGATVASWEVARDEGLFTSVLLGIAAGLVAWMALAICYAVYSDVTAKSMASERTDDLHE